MTTKQQLASDAAQERKEYKLNKRDVAVILLALDRLGNALDKGTAVPELAEKGLDVNDLDHAYEQF
jgi:hypothetical protein